MPPSATRLRREVCALGAEADNPLFNRSLWVAERGQIDIGH